MLRHLLTADIRRFRLTILAWLALQAVVAATQIVLPSLDAGAGLRAATSFSWLAAEVLAIVLVVLVVQTDPLVGADAFWMTRPIPSSALLASKLTLLGALMIVVPVMSDLLQMIVYHVPAGGMLRVAIQSTLIDALWLGLVVAGAAVTANLAQFSTLVGAALASIALTMAAQLAYLVIGPKDLPPTSSGPEIPDPTGSVVVVVLLAAAAMLTIVVQYRTRSRRRAGAAGAAGLAAALIVAAWWPWPFLQPRVSVPDWAQQPSALRLAADVGTVDFRDDTGWFENRRLWRTGRAKLWLGGLAPGWSGTVGLLDASIDLDAGTSLRSAGGAYASAVSMDGSTEHPEQVVVRNVLDVRHLPTFHLPEGETATIFTVPEPDLLRHASAHGTYHGRFRVNLVHEEIAGILPLRAGLVFQDGPYRLAIDDVRVEPNGRLRIRSRQSQASSWFDRRLTPSYVFYLRNAHTSEAVAGTVWNQGEEPVLSQVGGSSAAASQNAGFAANALAIRFPAESSRPGQTFSLTQSWLDRAELVIVRVTREGSVERALTFDLTLLPASRGGVAPTSLPSSASRRPAPARSAQP